MRTHRDLLLCTRFLGVPSSISASPPSAAADDERWRLRPRLSARTRATAAVVSMPIAPRLDCIAAAVRPRAVADLTAGSVERLLPELFFMRCCMTIAFLRRRILARSSACSSVSSSPEPAAAASAATAASYAASSAASSASSSASRASMSGSTKSKMFLPSMISGIWSYAHSGCASV